MHRPPPRSARRIRSRAGQIRPRPAPHPAPAPHRLAAAADRPRPAAARASRLAAPGRPPGSRRRYCCRARPAPSAPRRPANGGAVCARWHGRRGSSARNPGYRRRSGAHPARAPGRRYTRRGEDCLAIAACVGSDVWQNYTHLRSGYPHPMTTVALDLAALAQSIKEWGRELGFQQVGIAGLDLSEHEAHLQRWLEAGYQGEMDYMAAHGSKRSHPEQLVPGTLRVVSLRMDYLPGDTQMAQRLGEPEKAYVSRYALC